MATERTLALIKPDAVANSAAGEILAMIQKAGLKVRALKMLRLGQAQARGFYAVHRERPFYDSLVAFMTEGPIIAAVLEGEGAVARYDPEAVRPEHRAQRRSRLRRSGDGAHGDRLRLLGARDRTLTPSP